MTDLQKRQKKAWQLPKPSSLLLMCFWPIYGLVFGYLERGTEGIQYTPVSCEWDSMIPFCEWFIFPYMFWFVYIIGMLVYGLFFDGDAFRRLMMFIIITYSLTLVIYMLFPTCQCLRPQRFERDNALTHFIAAFYRFDTNTNVCPSIHVLGAIAVSYAAWRSKAFSSAGWRLAFGMATLLIILSTVFLKQHSVLDVFAALLLTGAILPLCEVRCS